MFGKKVEKDVSQWLQKLLSFKAFGCGHICKILTLKIEGKRIKGCGIFEEKEYNTYINAYSLSYKHTHESTFTLTHTKTHTLIYKLAHIH